MPKQTIPLELANGAKVWIEVQMPSEEVEESYDDEERDVAFRLFKFADVARVVEGISQELTSALKAARPNKASFEFGLEVGLESGELVSMIVDASGKVDLKV